MTDKRIQELVKRGWDFVPYWSAFNEIWHVRVMKRSWGLVHECRDQDWDRAHAKAADWAEQEERIINGPDERRDTEPAPGMEDGHAAG